LNRGFCNSFNPKVAVAFWQLVYWHFGNAILIFLGSYSVMGISLDKPAAIATPARPSLSIDCTFLPKRLRSQFHQDDAYQSTQWYVKNYF
jgi:hypothetical protein